MTKLFLLQALYIMKSPLFRCKCFDNNRLPCQCGLRQPSASRSHHYIHVCIYLFIENVVQTHMYNIIEIERQHSVCYLNERITSPPGQRRHSLAVTIINHNNSCKYSKY